MIGGILGATLTVAITTADDAVWMVPYVVVSAKSPPQGDADAAAAADAQEVNNEGSCWCCCCRVFPSHLCCNSIGVLHALLFITTLEGLALICVVASNTLITMIPQKDDWILSAVGATFCWILAMAFFLKKWCKKRRRKREKEQQNEHEHQQNQQQQQKLLQRQQDEQQIIQTQVQDPSTGLVESTYAVQDYEALKDTTTSIETNTHYAVNDVENNHNNDNNNNDDDSSSDETKHMEFSPLTVISLTFVGALDEISYFPALLVGGVLTPSDLLWGTGLAAILIVMVVTCCLSKSKPLLDCLDSIPLYAVVAFFATILTIETILDYYNNKSN